MLTVSPLAKSGQKIKLDQVNIWGFGKEHLLYKWSKSQSLRLQRREGRVTARALLGT